MQPLVRLYLVVLRRNADRRTLASCRRFDVYLESEKRSSLMTKQRKPSIVFVHGLWADASCFGKLIRTLQKEGFEVIASQHGLDSHAGDVVCVKKALSQVSAPAILVGPSFGGSVITAAGTDPRVAGL